MLYDSMKQSLSGIAIAVLFSAFLIVVRGYRNIVALPAVVNNDVLVDRYRPESTLIFFGGIPGIAIALLTDTTDRHAKYKF